jgi:hypothetical protein
MKPVKPSLYPILIDSPLGGAVVSLLGGGLLLFAAGDDEHADCNDRDQ